MSRLANALVRWDQWFYRLGIQLGQGEVVRRDAPAWLIGRIGVRGRLLLTDSALYFKSSSSVIVRNPQIELRLMLTDIQQASVRDHIEWRAALPGLASFEVKSGVESYMFQTAHSDGWVAAISIEQS